MKILLVTSTFQKTEDEKITDFVFMLAQEYIKKGHEVSVLAAHMPGLPKTEVMRGIEVNRFQYFFPASLQKLAYRYGLAENFKRSALAKIQLPFYLVAGTLSLRGLIKRFNPDIVHALWAFPQGTMCAFLENFSKFPLAVTFIGSEVYLAKKFRLPQLVSYAAKKATLLASVSSSTTKAARECGVKKPLTLIMYGADDKTFNPQNSADTVIKEFNLKKDDYVLLSIGRMVERKGQRYLIEAMPNVVKEIPNTKLLIVGFGPMENELRERTKQLGMENNIIFAGIRSPEKLAHFYAAADVFIIPSVVDSSGVAEGGQGLVTKKAMLSATCVIGTNIGGIPDIVRDNETGLLVPEKNPEALAEAIIKLKDPVLRKKLAKAGYELALKNITWEKCAENYLALYKKAMNEYI